MESDNRSWRKIAAHEETRKARAWSRALRLIGLLALVASLSGGAFSAEEKPGSGQEAGTGSRGNEAGGEVAARVNGVEITRAAVEARMGRMLAGRRHDGGPGEIETLRKEALDTLILQELAYQEARGAGVKIGSEELDKAIAEIKEKVGGEEKYRQALEKRGVNEDSLKKDLERNLLIKRIFEKEVAGRIVIAEDDVKKEYERIKGEFYKPEKVVIDDIILLLDVDDANSVKAAEAALIEKIKGDKHKDPRDLSPDGTFVVLEVELKQNKQKELYDTARKLTEGEVSGVIKTPDSLHVIKLKKYTPEVKAEFAQIRGIIERRLRAQAQKGLMEEWEAGLKKSAKIEMLDNGEPQEKKQ